MIEVIVPKLYEDFEGGTLTDWLKNLGDYVGREEAIYSLETDKAVFEIEAEQEGYLKEILAPRGSVVKPMQVVAFLARDRE